MNAIRPAANPSWGRNLTRLIESRYDSQRQAARDLGVKQTTLSAWCHGSWPGEVVAQQLAARLGVEYLRLVTGEADKPDEYLMESAITVANEVIAETIGTVNPTVHAKLVNLAYGKLRDGGKPWDLPTYLRSLIALISSSNRVESPPCGFGGNIPVAPKSA